VRKKIQNAIHHADSFPDDVSKRLVVVALDLMNDVFSESDFINRIAVLSMILIDKTIPSVPIIRVGCVPCPDTEPII
jgi:hypothetical protein